MIGRGLLTLSALCLLSGAAHAVTLFGVDEQNNLVSIDSAAPGTTLSSTKITGTDSQFLALDFRPANGKLYGLGGDYQLYRINTGTAVATAIGSPLGLSGTNFAFDFNPTIDRIRIVSNTGQNYVINPTSGTIQLVATPIAYGGSDPNAGRAPMVTAVAYTPAAQTGNPLDSQLYAIDSAGASDVFAKLANNTGVLTTVGTTGIDFGSRDSFDIAADGTAYALDGDSLYTVNLQTGAFSLVGNASRPLYGLSAAPVPEPAAWAMMIGGFGLIGGMIRRRATRTIVSYA